MIDPKLIELAKELIKVTPVSPEPPLTDRLEEAPPTVVYRDAWREGWAEGYRAALLRVGKKD